MNRKSIEKLMGDDKALEILGEREILARGYACLPSCHLARRSPARAEEEGFCSINVYARACAKAEDSDSSAALRMS